MDTNFLLHLDGDDLEKQIGRHIGIGVTIFAVPSSSPPPMSASPPSILSAPLRRGLPGASWTWPRVELSRQTPGRSPSPTAWDRSVPPGDPWCRLASVMARFTCCDRASTSRPCTGTRDSSISQSAVNAGAREAALGCRCHDLRQMVAPQILTSSQRAASREVPASQRHVRCGEPERETASGGRSWCRSSQDQHVGMYITYVSPFHRTSIPSAARLS